MTGEPGVVIIMHKKYYTWKTELEHSLNSYYNEEELFGKKWKLGKVEQSCSDEIRCVLRIAAALFSIVGVPVDLLVERRRVFTLVSALYCIGRNIDELRDWKMIVKPSTANMIVQDGLKKFLGGQEKIGAGKRGYS